MEETRITEAQGLAIVHRWIVEGKLLDCEVDGTPLTMDNATVHPVAGQLLIVCAACKRDLVHAQQELLKHYEPDVNEWKLPNGTPTS